MFVYNINSHMHLKNFKIEIIENLVEANTHTHSRHIHTYTYTHAHVICHVHLLRADDKTAKQSRIPDYVQVHTLYIILRYLRNSGKLAISGKH